jgi:hypothetical protein
MADTKTPPPIHVRASDDEKDLYRAITERLQYKNASAMHRRAPVAFDAAQRVVSKLHAEAERRKLKETELEVLGLLEGALAHELEDEQLLRSAARIHVRISAEDAERYDAIAGDWKVEPATMHRLAPFVLEAAHQVVDLLLAAADSRALTAVEDDALRRLDLDRWARASENGPLTERPAARR